MTDQSIFDKEVKEEQTNSPAPSTEPEGASSEPDKLSDLLASIRNEQGEVKYSTVEDALKGAAHAQEFISSKKSELEQLRQELETLREENAKYKGAEKAMLELNQPSQPEEQSQPAGSKGLDEEGAAQLIEKLLAQKEQKARAEQNVSQVTSALKEKFGEKAGEVFYSKAESLGLTKEQMNQLAAQSPKAALSYFEGMQTSNLNPTQTSVNTAGQEPTKKDFNSPIPPPEQSMLLGASGKDLVNEMARHKQRVYEKFGISQ